MDCLQAAAKATEAAAPKATKAATAATAATGRSAHANADDSVRQELAAGNKAARHWRGPLERNSWVSGLTARRAAGQRGGVMSESLGLTSHKSNCNCTGCGMLRAGVCINCAEKIAALILESGSEATRI